MVCRKRELTHPALAVIVDWRMRLRPGPQVCFLIVSPGWGIVPKGRRDQSPAVVDPGQPLGSPGSVAQRPSFTAACPRADSCLPAKQGHTEWPTGIRGLRE